MKRWMPMRTLIVALLFGAADVFAGGLTALQVQQIKAELTELVMNYGISRDQRDAQGWASNFTVDGRLLLGNEWFTGMDVLRTRVEKSDPDELTMHVVSTWQFKVIDKDTATGLVYMTVYRKTVKGPRAEGQAIPIDGFVALSKYADKYQRTKDGWKFAERRSMPVFTSAK
jgi:hypothetical protein